jgi:pantoate kinase
MNNKFKKYQLEEIQTQRNIQEAVAQKTNIVMEYLCEFDKIPTVDDLLEESRMIYDKLKELGFKVRFSFRENYKLFLMANE